MLLVDKVYFYIKKKIENNEYLPGSPLIEQNIQKELSISRTPIREAIRKLEKEDLIIKYPRKGGIVNAISLREIVEIYKFRELIEPNIIPLVIGKIPRNLIDNIEKELQNIKNKKPLNIEKSEKAGKKVHDLIIKRTKINKLFLKEGIVYDVI